MALTRKKQPGSTDLADRLMTLSGQQINNGETEAGHAIVFLAESLIGGSLLTGLAGNGHRYPHAKSA